MTDFGTSAAKLAPTPTQPNANISASTAPTDMLYIEQHRYQHEQSQNRSIARCRKALLLAPHATTPVRSQASQSPVASNPPRLPTKTSQRLLCSQLLLLQLQFGESPSPDTTTLHCIMVAVTASAQTAVPQFDVIVVGAGVAGGALTNALARDGRTVLCIERQLFDKGTCHLAEPSRIVGELLQPGGYAKLCQLGLSDALEGIDAQKIYGYGIFLGKDARCIPYTPPNEEMRPRPTGRSFHNGRFLRRLREMAAAEPNVSLVEGSVCALDMEGSRVVGVSYRVGDKLCHARAHLTVACDGCSSLLRRRASAPKDVSVYSMFHGLVLDMTDIPFPNHGHVVIADPTPVLFYPISSTEVRCLVDISSDFRGHASDYMLEVVAPQVPPEFRGPFERAVRDGKARMMPNRVMPAAADILPGAVLLGDAFNMRHPLTGGGMTVALSDIQLIRDILRTVPRLADSLTVSKRLSNFYEDRKPLSSTINILANALYSLFCAQDPALREMRDACFLYITAGGRMTHDPIGMLAGIKPYRFLLVGHFFAVALFGCCRALMPYPTVDRVCRAWRIFRASYNVIKPHIDAEKLSPLHWIPIKSL